MPQVPINYLGVLLAAIASIVLGFIWYGPLFGKKWLELMGWSPDRITAMKEQGGMGKTYAIAALGSLVMSYVLAHSLIFASSYFDASGVSAGFTVGFWNWLGFVAPVTLGMVLWEGKPWRLWILNNGYQLLALLVMGAILASL